MLGEALKGHLDLLLLAILSEGPAHGYAVIESLRQRSGNLFDLPEGTIYPALHRLELRGLLAAQWDVSANNRRAKYYRLTPKGRKRLREATESWRRASSAINRVLEAI